LNSHTAEMAGKVRGILFAKGLMIKGSSPCRNKRQRLQGCDRTLWKFGRRNGKMGLTGPDGPV